MTDRITGGLLLLITLGYAYMGYHFKVGFMADPIGPKAFPLLIAGLLFLFILYILIRPDPEPQWPGLKIWLNMALVLFSLVIYAYALVPLGFIATTTLEVTILAVIFKGQLWKGIIASLVLSLTLYAGFVFLLDIPLPVGKIFGG